MSALREGLESGPVEVSRKQVVRMVLRCLREQSPIAVVRFGEGEGRLLVAEADDPTSVKVAVKKLRRQTGTVFSTSEMFKVRTLVANAFDEAEVVGIRGSSSFSDEHKEWVEQIEKTFYERVARGRRPAYVAHSLISNELRDALPEFLDGQRQVSVISSRDVREAIQRDYGVEDVRIYQVPSQYITRRVDGEYEAALHDVPIWPSFYKRLRDQVSVRQPGEIFLVGAGVFGKDLCIRIRDLGGIALDIGSCLDGMAGKVTRGPNRPEPYSRPAAR